MPIVESLPPQDGDLEQLTRQFDDLILDNAARGQLKVGPLDDDDLSLDFTPESVEHVRAYCADPQQLAGWSGLRQQLEPSPERTDPEFAALRELTEAVTRQTALTQAYAEGDLAAIATLEWDIYGHMYSRSMLAMAAAAALEHFDRLDPSIQPNVYRHSRLALPLLERVAASNEQDYRQTTTLSARAKDEVAGWLDEHCGASLEQVDEDARYDPVGLRQVLATAMAAMPEFDGSDWRVELIDSNNSTVRVENSLRLVTVSSSMVPVTRLKAKKLIIHELAGHAGRSVRAEHSGSAVGQYGTAQHGQFEESLCILAESAPFSDDNRGLPGVINYVATGLAIESGNLGISRHDILTVTSAIKRSILAVPKGRDISLEEDAANRAAYTLPTRKLFPGIPPTAVGTAHLAHLKYLYGLQQAASILNNASQLSETTQTMDWLMSASFNPFQATDRAMVEAHHPMSEGIRNLVTATQGSESS